jgi:putative FmdB family regulatory protein
LPIYVYRCEHCGSQFEKRQSFSDQPLTECESCHGRVYKVLQPTAIVFKGSGFYCTDHKATSSAGNGTNGNSTGSESSDGNGSSTEKKSSAEKGSETTPASTKTPEKTPEKKGSGAASAPAASKD